MSLRTSALTLAWVLLIACASPQVIRDSTKPATGAEFDALAARFSKDFKALQVPSLELSFVANLEKLGTKAELEKQKAVLSKYLPALARLDPSRMDACRRIDHSIIVAEAEFGLRRAELGLRYLREAQLPKMPATLRQVPLGDDWYRYFLARWNGVELEPDAIFAFGETALRKSVAQYDALQEQMGFAGNAEGLAAFLKKSPRRRKRGEDTRALFLERQRTVWDHFETLFFPVPGIEPAKIEEVDPARSFPAPGYYDGDTSTFYYNMLGATFDSRQADWLFLHEGTPGHHLQSKAGRQDRFCQRRSPRTFFPAYMEGWAAYVETLGGALGLYQTPQAQLAAVEWDMVRSARVALDIAINAYGWSDRKALEYWHSNVRGQRDIAEREIARMRRWPAQVITYKFGAAVFERLAREASAADARAFHRAALEFGAMPLSTFESLLPQLLEHAKTQQNASTGR